MADPPMNQQFHRPVRLAHYRRNVPDRQVVPEPKYESRPLVEWQPCDEGPDSAHLITVSGQLIWRMLLRQVVELFERLELGAAPLAIFDGIQRDSIEPGDKEVAPCTDNAASPSEPS